MTLIVVVKEDDQSLLIAADGLERSSNNVYTITKRPKLHKASQGGLAWAASGNATVAEWLAEKLTAQPPNSWATMRDNTAGIPLIVANLNGDQRHILAGARAPWRNDFGVTCVIAGWLEGELGIWEIDNCGQPTPYLEHGFCAIGGPASTAEHISTALFDSPKNPLEKLKTIFNAIIKGIPSIGYPLDIWRITPGGVTIVEGRDDDQGQ